MSPASTCKSRATPPRTIDFLPHSSKVPIYPDGHWNTPFVGGSYQWLTKGGARNFDACDVPLRATVNTTAMAVAMPGIGSQYASSNLSNQTSPKANADGSVDVYFGPTCPADAANCRRPVSPVQVLTCAPPLIGIIPPLPTCL
jgi:hypothetical protein